MPKPAPKTTRRRGKRRKFQPGFYLTPEAETVLGEITKGLVAEFINQAIVLLARVNKTTNQLWLAPAVGASRNSQIIGNMCTRKRVCLCESSPHANRRLQLGAIGLSDRQCDSIPSWVCTCTKPASQG